MKVTRPNSTLKADTDKGLHRTQGLRPTGFHTKTPWVPIAGYPAGESEPIRRSPSSKELRPTGPLTARSPDTKQAREVRQRKPGRSEGRGIRRPISTCSKAQRDAVRDAACLNCGYEGKCDPAHVWPSGRGGDCGGPLDVIPLCRRCHRAFDDGGQGVDLLSIMVADWPKWRAHVQHALSHADGPVQLLERLAGQRIVWG